MARDVAQDVGRDGLQGAGRADGGEPSPRGARGGPAARPARAPLDAASRARIGRGLRDHYAAVLDLPVPDRLLALLDDLAARPDRDPPR